MNDKESELAIATATSVTCHVCDGVEFTTDSTGNTINCAECGSKFETENQLGLEIFLDDKTRMDIRGNDNEILYEEIDWQLIKTSKGQHSFYIMVDKMAGTNIRIEYHDDAWAIRDMLKIMREDST